MEVHWEDKDTPKIEHIKVHTEGERIKLNFSWPNEIETVYIYKANLLIHETIDYDKPYRKYTKNEYINFGGFIDEKISGGLIKYVVCPYRQNQFESYIVGFKDHSNEVQVIASRIQIKYDIKEKHKLFNKRKTVQIQVFTEVEMPKEYLCYVKKKGSIPVSPSDGIRFQFVDDFHAGDNYLPEIEVDKDEYVRIYLTEEVPCKQAYQIIKE